MPKETIATTDVYDGDTPHTNILKVAWGAKGDCPGPPDGWVNAGFAHMYIGTKDDPFLGTVELGEDEIDHLIRVLKRVRRQAFRVSPNGVNFESHGGVGISPPAWGGDIIKAMHAGADGRPCKCPSGGCTTAV